MLFCYNQTFTTNIGKPIEISFETNLQKMKILTY